MYKKPAPRLPTDFQVLNAIYERYYRAFNDEGKTRLSENYVPIDIKAIARDLNTTPELLFVRLYADIDYRHRYQQPDGSWMHVFYLKFEQDGREDRHCINFPYMASVLASLKEQQRRYETNTWLARVAIVAASVSAISSVIALIN